MSRGWRLLWVALWTAFLMSAFLIPGVWPAGADEAGDVAYIQRFNKAFPPVEAVPEMATYATPARYDTLYLGQDLDKAVLDVNNDRGALAWGLSYRMASLNEMYRVTKDVKYLVANRRCIEACLAATDDHRGLALFNGTTVEAWGCTKYAKRGRAVFAVHTGIITAPMFDFLLLSKGTEVFEGEGGDAARAAILRGARAALAVHDRQWRDGPEEGAGHYVGLDQERVCENKPLPGNRLSAIGWAHWLCSKVTGGEKDRARVLALGRYIQHRLTRTPEGAYTWPYWLPPDPVQGTRPLTAVVGEDTSHAGLTMALPFALAADGEVFLAADLQRLAQTVVKGFGRLGDGILISRINGVTTMAPSTLGIPANWLFLAKTDPAVRTPIEAFYLRHKPIPGPLDLALLLRGGEGD